MWRLCGYKDLVGPVWMENTPEGLSKDVSDVAGFKELMEVFTSLAYLKNTSK